MPPNGQVTRLHSKLLLCGAVLAFLSAAACGSTSKPTDAEDAVSSAAELSAQCEVKDVIEGPVRGSNPTLVARSAGILDLFYDGPNASGRHRSFDRTTSTWSPEEDVGGYIVGKPGAAAWNFLSGTGEGRLDMFVASGDSSLYHKWFSPTTGWVAGPGGWDPMGGTPGTVKSGVSVASWGTGRLDAFYLGADALLRIRSWAGGWQPEATVGATPLVGDPAAVSWSSDRLDIFARNKADNGLWHKYYDHGWGGEGVLAANLASSPTVTTFGTNRLDMFWRDPSNALKHMAWGAHGWTAEEDMGGAPISGDPAAASFEKGRIDLIAEDLASHKLVHRTWFDDGSGKLVPQGCVDSQKSSGTQCDFGLLAWNQGTAGKAYTCSGGVEYSNFKLGCAALVPPNGTPGADANSPKYCPRIDVPQTKKQPRKCDWADMGTQYNLLVARPWTERRVWMDGDNAAHPVGYTLVEHDVDASKSCAALIQPILDQQHTLRFSQLVTVSHVTPIMTGGNPKPKAGIAIGPFPYCQYNFDNYPVTIHTQEANADHCGADDVPDPSPPSPKYGWPACADPGYVADGRACTTGCMGIDDNNTCGETPGYLPFDKSLSDVPVGNGHPASAACLTDENHSISAASPATDVNLKFGRLQANLTRAIAGLVPSLDNPSLVRRLVAEMKLLFEMYGDQLSLDQQKVLAKLYVDYPDADNTPGCGMAFAPPSTPQCSFDPAALATLNKTMAFCARMTSGHVSPKVRDLDVVKYACIDAGTTIAKLRAPLTAAGGVDDGTATPDAKDVCGFKAYRAAYDTFVTTPLGARMSDPRDPRLAADQPELQARLYLMDRWYRAIEAMYPYASSELNGTLVRKAAWTLAQNMEGSLWRGVYRNLFPQGPVTATEGGNVGSAGTGVPKPPVTTLDAAALTALTHDSLKADHDLLKLAFTAYSPGTGMPKALPLQTTPLLILVADALEGMSQRMQEVGIYHDMGCAYVGCTKGIDSEIVHMVELLSDLADPVALSSALGIAKSRKDASGNPLVRADWLDVYEAISLNHPILQLALKDAQSGGTAWTYPANQRFLENGGAADLPEPARHLAGLVQGMRSRGHTYNATGLFNPSARNRLTAGVQDDSIQALRRDIAGLTSTLGTKVQNYDDALTTLSTQVIQEMGLKAQATRSSNEIQQKLVQVHALSSDVAALADAVETNEKEFGQSVQSFGAKTAFDVNGIIQAGVLPGGATFQLGASAAKATGPISGDVSGAAAKAFLNIAKGTIVTIGVGAGDRWAPSCALQQTTLPSPKSGDKVKVVTAPSGPQVLTGPEGYLVTLSSSAFVATKNDTAAGTHEEHHDSFDYKACTGNKAEGGISLFGSGEQVYNDISLCLGGGGSASQSVSSSSGTSDGSELKSSSSFVSGMRLKNTPITGAPVGALLAITTPKDRHDVITDIRVVQAPATTMVLDQASDLFLLVNDVKVGGCVVDDSSRLNVTATSAVTTGAAYSWLTAGIGNLAQALHTMGGEDGDQSTAATGLIAQGRLLPEQEANIRSQAMLALVKDCKAAVSDATLCDPSKLPESIRNFITAVIDRELVRIALKVQIVTIRREISALALQIQSAVDDYNASMAQGRVAELLPKWTLRTLDAEILRAETAALVNKVTYDLYPVLQLRYPALLPTLLVDDTIGPALMTLVNAKWDAPVKDLARAAASAATKLGVSTDSIQTRFTPLEPKQIVLSFPAPGTISTDWMHADPARSNLVWAQATTGDHLASFHVEPEDLYRKSGGYSNLLCTEEVPVIRDFAVVLGGGTIGRPDEDTVNAKGLHVPSLTAPTMVFPTASLFDGNKNLFTAGGPLDFSISTEWTSLGTQIMVTQDVSQALKKYQAGRSDPTRNVNGRGLSPFTTFMVDFSALYDPSVATPDPRGVATSPLDLATQIILVMDVEYRRVAAERTMKWISTCQ